ncbi:MAG TPA: cytochrome C oxidase subunit IV family protein [Terriglobales bacterium]|nr:cytochrome C oxidase subunit IV family protein [Terriglobales bacterium]
MSAHIGSLKVYVGVFMVLMIGTAITIYAAFLDLGLFNAPIALVIATVKAIFVVLFFMHVKDSDRLTKITVAAGIFWLAILLSLTMTDFLSRTWY